MNHMPFVKMQATGNDFLICDWRQNQRSHDIGVLSRQMADRNFGIGADQVLYLQASKICDAKMLVFNADGSQAEMSGNGIRCFAKYLFDHKIVKTQSMNIETLAGVMRPEIVATNSVGLAKKIRVNMGPAQSYQREKLKCRVFEGWDKSLCVESTDLAPDELWIHRVSMGNPHAVLFVTDVNAVPLEIWGPVIEHHAAFQNRTNFEIVQFVLPNQIYQRTWERGAGETLSCGTGACAAAQSVIEVQSVTKSFTVNLRGGPIDVQQDPEGNLIQSGEAQLICRGEFYHSELH